ncbi:asparagine synthase-related protein [Modestobacter italicus]|uniref:asparagine synthase-related protein n=1 Tax=Modestobacter italicus (strain DSM 44449 / CECT 9708 / BC 501) TaxID=2732864 RepID=UPI0002EFC065|nr:asparagine synthase-related protein [Modestobacter marinus]
MTEAVARHPHAPQLSPVEVAAGLTLGYEPGRRPPTATGVGMRAAFESVVREALCRPPCVVSFSGGRDSSTVLAVARLVAQREGLPPPVAVSLRFPSVAQAEESAWQEQVVAQVGLADWVRLPLADELDLLGPRGQQVLRRHGALWPANAFFHGPIADQATGGSLLTGVGGDELMTPSSVWDRVNLVRGRVVRPRPADLPMLLLSGLPAAARSWVLRRRSGPDLHAPWLRRGAGEQVQAAFAAMRTAGPVRHDRALLRFWGSRYLAVGLDSLARVGADAGATVFSPFSDGRVVAEAAADRGRMPPRSRSRAMLLAFSDVLPREILRRGSKASFNGAFWGPHTREFVAGWTGQGVDQALVDADALHRVWRGADPDARSYTLLQTAWLAAGRGSAAASAAQ